MLNEKYSNAFVGLGRMLIAMIFVLSGFDKLMNLNSVYMLVEYKDFIFQSHTLIIIYSLCEVVLGLMLLVGYKISLVCSLLIIQVVMVTIGMHDFWNMIATHKFIHIQFFLKNISLLGALFYMIGSLTDPWSLDKGYENLEARNKKRKRK